MIEKIRLPSPKATKPTEKDELLALREELYIMARSMNSILENIDKRLNAIEEDKK